MHIEIYLLECYPPSALAVLGVHVLMLSKSHHFCVSHFSIQFSSHGYEHTSLKLEKAVIYTQPRLSGKDFHGLVFTNKRTDWIACHNRNSIQWHMYAHTHHHCGPVINLRSLVQLIWLKVTTLAVNVELETWPVCMDMRGVRVQTQYLSCMNMDFQCIKVPCPRINH